MDETSFREKVFEDAIKLRLEEETFKIGLKAVISDFVRVRHREITDRRGKAI